MVRRFSVAVAATLAMGVLLLLGFKVDRLDEGASYDCLGASSITGACEWGGDSVITGEWWTQPGYEAFTSFDVGNNVDDALRASVSATVKREGVTVATPFDEDTCMGCESLYAEVSGSVEGCDGEPSITVSINATHEVEVTETNGEEEIFYSDDSKFFSCP